MMNITLCVGKKLNTVIRHNLSHLVTACDVEVEGELWLFTLKCKWEEFERGSWNGDIFINGWNIGRTSHPFTINNEEFNEQIIWETHEDII
jgi:hypothetical protein